MMVTKYKEAKKNKKRIKNTVEKGKTKSTSRVTRKEY